MERLSRLRDLVKWILISSVKLLMWAYGAILTLTGMVSSAVDAQKMRTLRAAIAGMVPVVGNLVSEASSSLLSTASLLRTSVGVYGMLAVFGIFLTPFLRIGVQYLALKLAAALSGFFGKGSQAPLLEKLAQAVGLLLALTALASLLSLMILVHCIRTVSQ
jgi:stage III sporulation protein AE